MANYKEFINNAKPEFEKAFKFLEGEMAKIRTSRASPALVEDIEVNAFGQKFPLKQLGSISTPATNQIVIQPWDASYIEPIEKAISSIRIGMSAVVDKTIIRLNLPLLTEEYRNHYQKCWAKKRKQQNKQCGRPEKMLE